MSKHFFSNRRQLLGLGGTGIVSFLGGASVIKALDLQTNPPLTNDQPSFLEENKQSYLSPTGFNQDFLAKSADVKQIWDFVTLDQINSGCAAIKNAMNAFQFTYKKSLYPVICLRSNTVIYGLNDNIWIKYRLDTIFDQIGGVSTDGNPLYSRQTVDNGKLSPDDPNSLYQDTSIQALLQRGASLALCHDALQGLAARIAVQKQLTIESTYKEIVIHLVPGAQQTPSGSSLIAVAQHLGFTYAKQ
ncbi:MAG TPA: hypothetical protein VFA41_12575 [Ktedonobacteraceae bacterium]|jgi:hypothetical protein|nr:hypothetical protein [Ktedonobacteraceae bacterium]